MQHSSAGSASSNIGAVTRNSLGSTVFWGEHENKEVGGKLSASLQTYHSAASSAARSFTWIS